MTNLNRRGVAATAAAAIAAAAAAIAVGAGAGAVSALFVDCEGDLQSGAVVFVEAVSLEGVEGDGGLEGVFEINEAVVVYSARRGLLLDQPHVNEPREGAEDVRHLPFGRVVGNPVDVQPVGGILRHVEDRKVSPLQQRVHRSRLVILGGVSRVIRSEVLRHRGLLVRLLPTFLLELYIH